MMRPRVQSLMLRGGDQLAALDARTAYHRLIVQAIRLALPRRFDPSMARNLEATFELRVRGPGDGGPERFALRIADGRCALTPGGADDPGATATIGADDMIRLVSGGAGWPELLSSGRLELSGDPFLALRFPMLFHLPAASVR